MLRSFYHPQVHWARWPESSLSRIQPLVAQTVKHKLLLVIGVLAGLYLVLQVSAIDERAAPIERAAPVEQSADSDLRRAYEERRSNYQVQGAGVVTRILAEDNDGSRHQRFILTLASDQTVLVAHNIDLAPRIASIQVGDVVSFFGEYEWNAQGGVIHWTHHDPDRDHVSGWLEHDGRRYQ
jgi:hypothetical protein